jgi:hypothetical protein
MKAVFRVNGGVKCEVVVGRNAETCEKHRYWKTVCSAIATWAVIAGD